jgi:NADH:ubiquinone oxidoreductase subunit F (NADH-binding)
MKVYEEIGGYQSLKKAFSQKPEEIVEAVKASGCGVAVERGFLLD